MHRETGVPANWTRVTADQIISDRPVVLYGIQAYLAGQTAGQFIIRNGQTDLAPIVATIDMNASQSKNLTLNRGVLLDAGLFIDMDDYVTEVTVYWLPFVPPVPPSADHREVRSHAS